MSNAAIFAIAVAGAMQAQGRLDADGLNPGQFLGQDHVYDVPTIEFFGEQEEGWKAFHVALLYGLHPTKLMRQWSIRGGEPVEPCWAMTFERRFKPLTWEEVETIASYI